MRNCLFCGGLLPKDAEVPWHGSFGQPCDRYLRERIDKAEARLDDIEDRMDMLMAKVKAAQ